MSSTQRTEPALVTTARRMQATGTPWRDIARELEANAGGSRDALAEATLHWVSGMRHRPSDDFQSYAVLRALEAALARAPRGPEDESTPQ